MGNSPDGTWRTPSVYTQTRNYARRSIDLNSVHRAEPMRGAFARYLRLVSEHAGARAAGIRRCLIFGRLLECLQPANVGVLRFQFSNQVIDRGRLSPELEDTIPFVLKFDNSITVVHDAPPSFLVIPPMLFLPHTKDKRPPWRLFFCLCMRRAAAVNREDSGAAPFVAVPAVNRRRKRASGANSAAGQSRAQRLPPRTQAPVQP